jgi:hypothetical protein
MATTCEKLWIEGKVEGVTRKVEKLYDGKYPE